MEPITDINSHISPKRLAPSLSITAGAGQDNVAQVGTIIDLHAINWPKSVSVVFPVLTTLASAATLKLKSVIVEHDDDPALGSAATLATLESSTGTAIATGVLTASQVVKKYGVNLQSSKRYVRLTYTADLSAAGTDTCVVGAVLGIFAGSYTQPSA